MLSRMRRTGPAMLVLAAGVPAFWPLGAHASLRPPNDPDSSKTVQIDSRAGGTKVATRIGNRCLTMVLPSEWRLLSNDRKSMVLSNREGAELEAALRPVREVENLPQPDPASRDAARLQRDHEDLFGRPAQAATVASLSAGAKRWTATWIDVNLPSASHEMTLDTLIVPLSGEWLLELSLSQVAAPAAYEALIRTILSGIAVGSTDACRSDDP